MDDKDCKKKATDYQVGGSFYRDMPYQPISLISALKFNFFQGNVLKYVCRHKSKNGREDLEKAVHYCLLAKQYKPRRVKCETDRGEINRFIEQNGLGWKMFGLLLAISNQWWDDCIKQIEGIKNECYGFKEGEDS